MINKKELVPSLLAFDPNNWINDFQIFKSNSIDYIHYDVMDKEYVGNTAFDKQEYQIFLNNNLGLKSHVHLMVLNPLKHIDNYLCEQTDAICFHFDTVSFDEAIICLNKIKAHNIKAGIAISPNFSYSDFEKFLPYCNIVTIMGVYPGKGGQSFIESTINNIKSVVKYNLENKTNIKIELDGGMNFETIPLIFSITDFVVAGSFLKKNIDKISEIMKWFNSI